MTMTLPTTRPQEARRAMTRPAQPRARALTLTEQLDARRAAITRTPEAYGRHRTALLRLAAQVRRDGRHLSRADLWTHLQPVRVAMLAARAAHAEHQARDAQVRAALPADPAAARRTGQQIAAQTGTLRQLAANRRRLIQLAWNARRAGDAHTYAELRRALDRVTARLHAAAPGRRLSPQERTHAARLHATPTPQLDREAQQRIDHDHREDTRAAQRQERDARARAINALAHALHGLHSGARDWQVLPTRPTTLPASTPSGEDRGTPGAQGPARLEIRVPGEPFTLHLYRADYEQLLDLWGYGHVRRTLAATQALALTAPAQAVREAEELMLAAVRHPNLARSLHTYLTGPFGDVYVPHKASGTQQLGSSRSGDLREALNQLYAACKLTVNND